MWIFKSDAPAIDKHTPLEVENLIRLVEAADQSDSLVSAIENLAKAHSIYAIPTLITTLGFNNPGAALAAVDGLVALGEISVLPLMNTLDSYNYGARAWSIRALGLIGDVRSLEILEEALSGDITPGVRRAAAKGLGNLKLNELPNEQRDTIRARLLTALEAGCHDAEWQVQYAVIVGFESSILFNPKDSEFTLRGLRALQYLSLANIPVIKQRAVMAIKNINEYTIIKTD